MQKISQLAHNTVAFTLLIAIIATATITTLSLSPIAVDSKGQAAGVSTTSNDPQVLSNFLPLQITDLSQPQANYVSQLAQWNERKYEYSVQLGKQNTGIRTEPSLTVKNNNSVPVKVSIAANVPQELVNSLTLNVSTTDQSWRLHTAKSTGDRVAQIEIPADASLNLSIKYEYEQAVNFPSSVSLEISF
jgi:hypothetical protein